MAKAEEYLLRVDQLHAPDLGAEEQLPVCTRARCYSPLAFLVTMGVLHIEEIGEGQ
jgi:hypothetical protein